MIEDAFPTDERKIEDLQMPLIPKRHGPCSSWQGPAAVVYDHVIISICKQRIALIPASEPNVRLTTLNFTFSTNTSQQFLSSSKHFLPVLQV